MEEPLAPPTANKSAIPRPGTRLPLLRPATCQLPPPSSPEARPPLSQQAKRQSIIRPPTAPSHRNNVSIASSHSSTSHSPSKASSITGRIRQPLGLSSRPQSRHDSAISQTSFEQHVAATRAKGYRHPSQQENTFYITDSPEESDASTEMSDKLTMSPVLTARRPPRPSLSDRTMESLSSIPPSPRVAAKRPSFYGAQSPTTLSRPSSRPSSSIGPVTLSKPSSTIGRNSGFVRPPSPTKRLENGTLPRTPARRTVISALPKSNASTMPSPHKRVESTPKASIRPAQTPATIKSLAQPAARTQIAAPRPRPVSMIGTPARSQPAAMARPAQRPITSTAKPKRAATAVSRSPTSGREGDQQASPRAITKSSDGLRAQIAAAKATHKATASFSPSKKCRSYDFEDHDDPFNQTRSSPTVLAKRIDVARRDGRLNIAALELTQISDEIMTMYDAEAMEASSVSWSETVDLVRLNAADNMFEEIRDDAFPDASAEELASRQEPAVSQFGGLEALDLHGNALRAVPMGLRRLERLTTLNLTRNKLDNSVFSVLTQITSLRELRLGENDLVREVPDTIGQLSNLEVLDLHGNKLSILPGSVRNLVNLRVLNLSDNRFAELPIGSVFSLPALTEVYAASNALTAAFFPMTVDIVRSLQVLDISNNSLASISFGTELHLPSMHYLNISRNRLFAIPNVSSWSSLITLLAEENSLTALPPGLTSLTKLKVADFQRNSLRILDPEIANMPALESLLIAANPLREKRLLSMTTTEMKDALAKKLDGTSANAAGTSS